MLAPTLGINPTALEVKALQFYWPVALQGLILSS